MFRHSLLWLAAFGIAHAAHANEFRAGEMRIVQPFARATAPGQPAAAAYLTIENKGGQKDRLISASTPAAKSVELHTMSRDGDVMRMRQVDDIPVDAGSSVAMKPGEGYHLMLLGLAAPLAKNASFPMTVVFEKAGKAEISVQVLDRNAGTAGSHSHQGNKHGGHAHH